MKDAYEDEYGEEPGGGGVWDPDKAGPPVKEDEPPITDWRKWFEDLYKSKGFSGYSESNLAAMEADLTSKGWQLQRIPRAGSGAASRHRRAKWWI